MNVNDTELNKVIEKVNNWCLCNCKHMYNIFNNCITIEQKLTMLQWAIKELAENQKNFSNGFNELKQYVDNYFNNLDLHKEVSDKIDEMAEEGELNKYLDPVLIKGKKLVFFGDSLTWGDIGDDTHSRAETPFPESIAQKTGCVSVNYGVKGAEASTFRSTSNLKTQLQGANLENADMVFIEFGTNDFNNITPLGDIDSTDWNTFCGAYNNAISEIASRNGKAIVYLLGMFPSTRLYSGAYNSSANTLKTFNEYIKMIANRMGCRYIDMSQNCGFNRSNYLSYSTDGVHYTNAGYGVIADVIIRNLGGNDCSVTPINNVLNRNLLAQYNQRFQYGVVINENENTWISFAEFTFGVGSYMIDFDYVCEMTPYDTSQFYAGVHCKLSNYFLTSIIGIKNGVGHMRQFFTVYTPQTGNLAFRSVNIDPDSKFINLYIKNVTITPLNGSIISANDRVTVNSENLSSPIAVTRFDSGQILITYSGSVDMAVNTYDPIVQNSIFKEISNLDRNCYFPIFISGRSNQNERNYIVARGQLIGSIIACNENILATDVLSFSFTI